MKSFILYGTADCRMFSHPLHIKRTLEVSCMIRALTSINIKVERKLVTIRRSQLGLQVLNLDQMATKDLMIRV